MFMGSGAARLKRLLKKSERQVPRGLKSARNIKNKGLIGTLRLRSGQASKSCPDTKLFGNEFFQLSFRALGPRKFMKIMPITQDNIGRAASYFRPSL